MGVRDRPVRVIGQAHDLRASLRVGCADLGELEDSPDGTIARIHAKGDAGGFYRLAAPLLNRMARRSMTNDLEMLKEYLEGQPQS